MQKVIAANWKMNKTIEETQTYIEELLPIVKQCDAKILLAVPATALWHAATLAAGTNIVIGAQNIDFHLNGAYTGEISAGMVKEAGGQFVILGHSERRKLFNESSAIVNLKAKAALKEGLQVILCLGESAEERENHSTETVLQTQLLASLAEFSTEEMARVLLAYEPLWAIGTGLPATPKDAYLAHRCCRECVAAHWNKSVADHLPILYGGSVKADNARDLLEAEGVDGLLVGGASLSVDSFTKIAFSQQCLKL